MLSTTIVTDRYRDEVCIVGTGTVTTGIHQDNGVTRTAQHEPAVLAHERWLKDLNRLVAADAGKRVGQHLCKMLSLLPIVRLSLTVLRPFDHFFHLLVC